MTIVTIIHVVRKIALYSSTPAVYRRMTGP